MNNNDVFELWGLIVHSLAGFRKKVIKHLGLLCFYWHESSWSSDVKSPWAVSHVLGLAFETLSLWAWLSALPPCGWILSSEVEHQKCSECFFLSAYKGMRWHASEYILQNLLTSCVVLQFPVCLVDLLLSWLSGSSAVMAHSCVTPYHAQFCSLNEVLRIKTGVLKSKKTSAPQHLITEEPPELPLPRAWPRKPSTPPHGSSSLRCRNLATIAASSLLLLSQLSWSWRCTLSNKSKTNPVDAGHTDPPTRFRLHPNHHQRHSPGSDIHSTQHSPVKIMCKWDEMGMKESVPKGLKVDWVIDGDFKWHCIIYNMDQYGR